MVLSASDPARGHVPAGREAPRHAYQGGAGAADPAHQQPRRDARTTPPRCATSRAAASACSPRCGIKTKELIPSGFRAGEFRHVGGHAVLRARATIPRMCGSKRSGGPISPDDEVRLLDDDDNEVAFGEVGELCARGPYTLRGYYGARRAQRARLHLGRLLPLGRSDAPAPVGQLHGRGRKKDLINRGGEKISAEEIENLILQHPAVQNVACVAMPDPALGERMCACVILHDGKTLTSRGAGRASSPPRRSPSSSCPSGSRS